MGKTIILTLLCFVCGAFSELSPVCANALLANKSLETLSSDMMRRRKKKATAVQKESKKETDYEKYTKGSRKDGLFTVYHEGKDYYFEVPLRLVGRDMLVVNKLLRVPEELNEAGVNRGVNYENKMIRFEMNHAHDALLVREQRPMPFAPKGDAIESSVKDNYISPLICAFDVLAFSPDSSAVVVKVNDVYDGTSKSINNVFDNINLGTSAISKLSHIESINAYEDNVKVVSELTTKVTEIKTTVYITVEVSSSILLLPEVPMQGRYDSRRVGYFTTTLLNYADNQQQTDKKSFITRWRMEPKEEDKADYLKGKLVEPKKPIVFYIDERTPAKWRKYIAKGIEDWQMAFEHAGFKNAIKAVMISDSLEEHLSDVDYSVLNYAASQKQNAMGPSLLDPRTGEILEADIMWWHNVLAMVREWIIVQTAAVCPEARTVNLPDSLMGDAIRFVACHEVGHSLGLRHNMIASWAYPTDSLRSEVFTNKMNSTAASIMDYARFNYVAQPGDGVKKLSPHIGPYDVFAIEYGYRWYGDVNSEQEKNLLYDYLQKHRGNMYKYSEVQAVRDAIDPRAQTEDLGNDAMASSRYGIENLKRIVPNILKWTRTGEKGQSYDEASKLYKAVINQWNSYLYHVMANVGGIYIENTSVGDGVQSFTFVEKEKQKEAVRFLNEEVLCMPEWLFGNDIRKFTFLNRETPNGRIEQSPTVLLKNAQAFVLWDLLSDSRLMRMMENEVVNGDKAYTMVELMDDLHRHIFGVTERGGQPDVMQRNLQKNFLDALITAASESKGVKVSKSLSSEDAQKEFMHLFVSPFCSEYAAEQMAVSNENRQAGPRHFSFYGSQLNRISDVVSVKRGEMLRIKALLKKRLSGANVANKYHYTDMIMRINTALGLND